MKRNQQDDQRQILGRVRSDEFIGRNAELRQLVSHATSRGDRRGVLILLAPLAGVSELLRQTFDELFNQRGDTVPIYFALPQSDTTAVSAAIEFLNTFLLQYVAYRRDEPLLCQASLTLNDLLELALVEDFDWIEELIESYNKQRFSNDDRAFVRLCLTAPGRVPANHPRPFIMFDAVHLGGYADLPVPFATEMFRALSHSSLRYSIAGLRREIMAEVECAGGEIEPLHRINLAQLGDRDARELVESTARRQQVTISDATRDLLVQQLEGSPFLITSMMQAARERHVVLDSYLACERLYVDELLGGRLHRHFSAVLERTAPDPETRRAIVRLLCEAVAPGNRTSTFETWCKRLSLEPAQVEKVLRRLHVEELVNWDGETIDVERGSPPWRDYLRSRFRLDALREPRALVVADLIMGALKRAPQTVTRHYRRASSLRLLELLESFNSQRVPRVLFHYDQFASRYKGAPQEEIDSGLESDTDITKLPQVVTVARGVSFSAELGAFGEEASVVAHGFEGATYEEANEIVWLVAKLDSKLEADRKLTETWLDRLDDLSRKSGFVRTQKWLIASEGFDSGAVALLRERGAHYSSEQQFEILVTLLSGSGRAQPGPIGQDEIEMVMPMGADYELLAANTVEQIARRLNFRPEAINQIKTAIVEACINASEHSLSPDRKIYQRYRVENDKLVITIASRGVVPSNLNGYNREQLAEEVGSLAEQRRGWGLKLIKTLMDEVEFERVDEGTRLRMSKHVRAGAQ